jgi:hypothetical protein
MIELPEAVVIAAQIDQHLRGQRIAEVVRGNAPHKWAFYSGPPEHYASMLNGRAMPGRHAMRRRSCLARDTGLPTSCPSPPPPRLSLSRPPESVSM